MNQIPSIAGTVARVPILVGPRNCGGPVVRQLADHVNGNSIYRPESRAITAENSTNALHSRRLAKLHLGVSWSTHMDEKGESADRIALQAEITSLAAFAASLAHRHVSNVTKPLTKDGSPTVRIILNLTKAGRQEKESQREGGSAPASARAVERFREPAIGTETSTRLLNAVTPRHELKKRYATRISTPSSPPTNGLRAAIIIAEPLSTARIRAKEYDQYELESLGRPRPQRTQQERGGRRRIYKSAPLQPYGQTFPS